MRERSSRVTELLIVEDDEDVREVTVELARQAGLPVHSACNGREALAVLAAHPAIGVVFTDMRMPVMGGQQLAAQALELRPDLTVIFATGADALDVPPGFRLVRKPFRKVELQGLLLAAAVRQQVPRSAEPALQAG